MDLEVLRRRQYEELARAAIAQCDEARKAHEQIAEFFGWEIEKAMRSELLGEPQALAG